MSATPYRAGPIPVMIKIWSERGSHRYRYIKRSLPSLLASDLPDTARIVMVDDRTTDHRVIDLMQSIAAADRRVQLWRNPERLGPNAGQARNFPRLVEAFPDAELFALTDDDVIYRPGWLQRLVQVHEEAGAIGVVGVVSGLNVTARPSYRELRLPTSAVLLKQRQLALNWLVPRPVYEQVGPFRDAGIAYDTEYCRRLAAKGFPIICLKPSWVQNIGYYGAYQSGNQYRAPDFVGRTDLWLKARDVCLRVRTALESMNESPAGRRIRPYLKRALIAGGLLPRRSS